MLAGARTAVSKLGPGRRPHADLTWHQGLHDRALWAGTASPGREGSALYTSRPFLSSHDLGQDPADDQL